MCFKKGKIKDFLHHEVIVNSRSFNGKMTDVKLANYLGISLQYLMQLKKTLRTELKEKEERKELKANGAE